MKIEITEPSDKEEVKFPCLMKSEKEAIVLFLSDSNGIALNDSRSAIIGHHSKEWHMPSFKPFKGKITLENS